MYFTREPIVETVITAKEGHKLLLRSSGGRGQEEFFADAVEVISFGNSCFYRSLERTKSFLVPVTDYEIVEARETKMVLKTPVVERGIKIGGGKEASRPQREPRETREPREAKEPRESRESKEPREAREPREAKEAPAEAGEATAEAAPESKGDRRRERRRFRRRKEERDSKEGGEENGNATSEERPREEKINLIPPPTTLISDTLSRYKGMPDFAGAFFDREKRDEIAAPPEVPAHVEGNREENSDDGE